MIKLKIDSMSAVKITENEGRVNAQISDASHVSQSVANQRLPDISDIRGMKARIVIREIPHILTIRAPGRLTRPREARNWPTALDRSARSHADDEALLAVPDMTRRTICLFNWTPCLSVSQPLLSLWIMCDSALLSIHYAAR